MTIVNSSQIQADGTTNLGSSFVGTKEAQGPHVTSTGMLTFMASNLALPPS